ncbi:hypothetical protein IH601_03885 [Candidatus Bipolaricaulota bacterium]|nr:hypothetical protein [Candidatus Bipolaricaulota bacterium]
MTLKEASASRFLAAVDGADDELAQLEMARITGNFKRGNEPADRRAETKTVKTATGGRSRFVPPRPLPAAD